MDIVGEDVSLKQQRDGMSQITETNQSRQSHECKELNKNWFNTFPMEKIWNSTIEQILEGKFCRSDSCV